MSTTISVNYVRGAGSGEISFFLGKIRAGLEDPKTRLLIRAKVGSKSRTVVLHSDGTFRLNLTAADMSLPATFQAATVDRQEERRLKDSMLELRHQLDVLNSAYELEQDQDRKNQLLEQIEIVRQRIGTITNRLGGLEQPIGSELDFLI